MCRKKGTTMGNARCGVVGVVPFPFWNKKQYNRTKNRKKTNTNYAREKSK